MNKGVSVGAPRRIYLLNLCRLTARIEGHPELWLLPSL